MNFDLLTQVRATLVKEGNKLKGIRSDIAKRTEPDVLETLEATPKKDWPKLPQHYVEAPVPKNKGTSSLYADAEREEQESDTATSAVSKALTALNKPGKPRENYKPPLKESVKRGKRYRFHPVNPHPDQVARLFSGSLYQDELISFQETLHHQHNVGKRWEYFVGQKLDKNQRVYKSTDDPYWVDKLIREHAAQDGHDKFTCHQRMSVHLTRHLLEWIALSSLTGLPKHL